MRRSISMMFALSVSLALFAGSAKAQSPGSDRLRERVRARILEIMKDEVITRAKLSGDAARRVAKVYDERSPPIMEIRAENRRLMRELALIVDTPGSDARFTEISDKILQNQQRIHELDRQRVDAIRAALSPAEFARVLVATPAISRAIGKRIADVLGR